MAFDLQTRQRLLELVYELLPEPEAAELRRRIDAEPELARAYAQAQRTAELLAEAARLRWPKIELKPPERTMSTSSDPSPATVTLKTNGPPSTPWARGANWAVGLAAAVLLMIALGLCLYHRGQVNKIAAEQVRLVVTGPARLQAGVDTEYAIATTMLSGDPMPAQVEVALYAPDGTQLLGHKEDSDEEGRLQVVIPAALEVPSGARIEVMAAHEGKEEQRVQTRLEVEPIRYATHLALDKPLYRPGETVYYRSLTLSRFGLAADREMPIHFEILDPSGAVMADSPLEGVSRRGVGNGAFPIPGGQPGGEYILVARSLDDSFPEERRPFFIRHYRLPRLEKELEFARDSYGPGDSVVADFLAERTEGGAAAGARLQIAAVVDDEIVFEKKDAQADETGAFQVKFDLPEEIQRGDGLLKVTVDDGGNQETIVKTIPINLGKVEVKFYPEGGDLAADLENRVYFVGRDPLGEPVHLEGTIEDGRGVDVAVVETTHEGMGSFSFTPRADEQYRLKITSPVDVAGKPELPQVSARQKIVLTTGMGVFDAGAPLEFNVRAAEPGLPLVVSAWCRGVQVGQQTLVTKVDENGANPVEISLPDEVGGVIRLTVYDYSTGPKTGPPKPVAERLVYRRMGRWLDVRPGGHSERYAPGDKVQMSLMVTDEKGEPVPAVLGVAVVNGALLNLADDDTPGMNTHFLLTTEVENPEDLEDADFYLSDDPEAEVALDLLLGTQGWRRFVEKTLLELKEEGRDDEQLTRLVAMGGPSSPPAMFDNLEEITAKYTRSRADYEAGHTQMLKALITISFFAALGLVLLVAMLGLLKVVSGIHLWVPAVGVTVCCLITGVILMDPGRFTAGPGRAVAFLPFSMEPLEVTETSERGGELVDDGDLELTEEEERVRNLIVELPVPDEAAALVEDLAEEDPAVLDDPAAKPDEAGAALRFELGAGRLMLADKDAALDFFRAEELEGEWIAGKDLKGWVGFGRELKKRKKELIADGKWNEELDAAWAKNLERFRFPVREYAHRHVEGQPDVRDDFTETLYWQPMLIADKDGRAPISFELSDSLTTFRLRVDAHGAGRIGSGMGELISRIPFNLEPKLPLEVNAGDRIELPLAVVNDTRGELPVELKLEHGDLVQIDGELQRKLELAAEQRGREYFVLNVTGQKGDCELKFSGTAQGAAGRLTDSVSRPLKVVPPGFPKDLSHSGEIDGPQEVVVELPEHWVAGSLEVTLNVFPSTLAELQKGMEGILREPCGCFEQASTSNYPNVLSMQYMQEHDVANPAVTRRAKDLLKKGYVKLVGYECKQKGYEWFGGDPGHEALTAYGLMEFRDMAEVYDVDEEMIKRTAQWLMDRRDGKGGFQRNSRALDSFGRAPQQITDAYIAWALSESGQEGITEEIKHVAQLAEKSDDPYLIALAAASVLNADKQDDAKKLLDKLADAQAEDGHLEGKEGSITRSGGHSLKVETTALAAMAWLKMPAYTRQAGKAIDWIVKSRQGSGGFGSTQATILALKALVEHSKASRKTLTAGTLIVKRDDLQIGEHAFGAGQQETIVIDGLEANLQPGENKLTVSLTGENKMPYALDVGFRTRKPDSDENCPVRLTAKLDKKKVKAGETVRLTAELSNTSKDDGQPMTIAILGLPAGLEARPDQLEELKEAGTIDYYETRAREVICYWRSLAPDKEVTVKLDLVAAVPGEYIGPASRTYLYYTSEQKQWADPLQIEITRD